MEPVLTVEGRVASEFFSTLGVPFIAGHDFRPHETRTRRSVIVTRQVAEALWPGESAIGKVLLAGPDDRAVEAEVIGIVRDAFFAGRSNQTRPRYVFFANAERPGPPGETTFYIRHSGSQDVLTPTVAKAFREVDARVAIARLRSLESQIAFDGAPLWMLATLLTLFAGGSLLIAAIGQYAVVAFDGRRRMREFGVRIALGASSRQLVSSVDLRKLPPDRSRSADWICSERRRGNVLWRASCTASLQPTRRPLPASSCCWLARLSSPVTYRRDARPVPIPWSS